MSSPGDDDAIGLERGVDVRSTNGSDDGYRSYTAAYKAVMMRRRKNKKSEREYPPPLPSLGVEMRRYYTVDGRLVIRKEKTSRRANEVFRADRSNGRLTLHFVRSESQNDAVSGDTVFEMDLGESEVGVEKSCDDECEIKASSKNSRS